MNKKLIISLSVIGIVAAVAIGGTVAYFSDVETSVGNKFVAGKLNLKIDNTCHYNGKECVMIEPGYYLWAGTDEECFCTWELKDLTGELYFDLEDIKPGDNGEDTVSLHIDNNDAWLCAAIANLANDDNGCDLPESLIDTTCGANEGELQNNLLFTIWKDDNCDNILDKGEQVLVQDEPAQAGYWPIADSNTGTPIPGGATVCYGIKWNCPLSTGNEIQSDSLMGDVIFTAIQARHMDSLICSPSGPCVPQDEVCDGVDNDCDGQIDEDDPQIGTPCDGPDSDLCQEGTYSCSAGALVCSDNTGSTVDLCNGIDDDCDPASADGSEDPQVGIPCDGPDPDLCKEGTYYCSAGALMCSDTTGATAEICNDGVDNDCDGYIDCADPDCNGQTCNDGIYCNGVDTCSAGSCSIHAGNPCPGPDGDGDCSESCHEVTDSCIALDPPGSSCNDGTYCNGIDTCNASGVCANHSGNPCPGPDGDTNCQESCNETADNCTANDPSGSSCNDGLYCTGIDTCNASGFCIHSGDPCPGPDGDWDCKESCDEYWDDCDKNDPNGTYCSSGWSSGHCYNGFCQ